MKILSDILVKAGVVVEQNISAASITAGANVVGGTVWSNSAFKNNNNGNMALSFSGTTVSITTNAGNVINAFGTGNVGIGTITDAGYKLDVNGEIRGTMYRGANGAPLITFDTSTNRVRLDNQGYGTTIGNSLIVGDYLHVEAKATFNSYIRVKGNNDVISYAIGRPDASAIDNASLAGMGVKFNTLWYTGAGLSFYVSQGTDISGGFNISEKLNLSPSGDLKVFNLAGTGSRMVVADSSGVLSTQAIPSLSNYVTLDTTQTISGAKTFNLSIKIDSGSSGQYLAFKQYPSGSTGLAGHTSIYAIGSDTFGISYGGANDILFKTASPTFPRTYTFPDANGTVALTSDLGNYVTTNTTQTVSGQKTFYSSTTVFDSNQTSTLIEGRAQGTLYGGMFFGLFVQYNAYAAATGGYLWKNSAGTNVMALSQTGDLTVANLAGSGDRMVVANSSGVLTTQAIPSGGTSASTRTIQKFTSTVNQTTFTITGGYTVGMVDVFLNGVKIDNATDFTATNGSTVVLTEALAAGQTVEVYKYGSQFIVNNGLRQTTLFSATAGQTTFTVSYSVGLVDVFYNGSKLDSSEYTATNGTSIVLGTACAANDKVEVIAYSYNVSGFTGVGGSGTTNYIPKWTASGTLGNSIISDNGSTATVAGDIRLDNGAADGAQLVLASSGFSDWNIDNFSGNFRWYYGATERMRLTAAGDYLLGATAQNGTSSRMYIRQSGDGVFKGINLVSAAAGQFVGSMSIDGSGNLNFGQSYLDAAGSYQGLTFNTSGSERMRITSSGNVGIGTSSPAVNLHISSGADTGIRLASSAGAYSTYIEMYGAGGGGAAIKAIGGVPMIFEVGGSQRMQITSDGKALFGTSTAGYGLFSTQRITINPISDGIVVGPLPQNNSAYTTQAGDNTGTRYALYIANGSSSAVGNISFTSSSTSYNTSSDYRLKQDLKNFNGLSILSKVKTYDFEWKIDNSRMYGVVAHELSEVLPYAVNGEKDGEQMQSVDYSKLVPVLVKAVQEEDAKVNAQELRIQQLEQEVITLKAQLGIN